MTSSCRRFAFKSTVVNDKMKPESPRKWKVLPFRRMIQVITFILIVLVIPFFSQNPQFPLPSISWIQGDTWSLTIGDISLTHPAALIDHLFSAGTLTVTLVFSVLLPLLITILFGRVFCSWFCPLGFILELISGINRYLKIKGIGRDFPVKDRRFHLFGICLILSFALGIPVMSIIDPPHMLGRESMTIFIHKHVGFAGMVYLLLILLFEVFFVSRAWCRYFCPSGGCLALIGMRRLCRITVDKSKCTDCNLCGRICPYELNPAFIDTKTGRTTCDNCGLCFDQCPTRAIAYRFWA